MGSRIPEHLIAEVRDRTDIVEVVGRYVQLRRAGSNQKGLCPFHDEKTPSFNVSPTRQFYHCFGCGESGDVFSFLQKIEGKPFFEVLRELADAAGVELPKPKQSPEDRRKESEREQCYRLTAMAAEFFERALQSSVGRQAKAYLESRQITAQTAAGFRLGCAPPGWDELTKRLAHARAPAALAEKLGLVARRRSAPPRQDAAEIVHPDRHYDFFRDRLMFPILGTGDRVLGFSGRLLDPEAKERKYVNSPEGPIYHKSEVLYGLPQARPAIRRAERVILVEGNLDVLAMSQQGFAETVAPLGTALTSRQAAILRRYAPEVILAYDGDDAGRAATRKATELLAGEPVLSRAAELPAGKDPADLVLALPEQMRQILDKAPAGRKFLIDQVARETGDTVEERVRSAERLAPILARIPGAVERDEYARLAAEALGLRATQMVQLLRGNRIRPAAGDAPRRPTDAKAAGFTPERRLVLALLALLVGQPHLALRAEQLGVASYIEDPLGRDLIRFAIQSQKDSGVVDSAALLARVPEPERDRVARSLLSEAFGSGQDEDTEGTAAPDPSRAFDQIVVRFRLTRMKKDLKNLENDIREAEQQDDMTRRKDLILRRIRLSQEKDELTRQAARGR